VAARGLAARWYNYVIEEKSFNMRISQLGLILTFLLAASAALLAQPAKVLNGQHGSVNSLAISPDNKFIAAGCSGKEEGTVLLWNLQSGELLQTWKGYIKYRQELAFSPDSKYLAISYDETSNGNNDGGLEIRNLADQRLQWKLTPQDWNVAQLHFSPDSQLLGCSCDDGRVRLFDVRSGQLKQTLGSDYFSQINTFAFSPDGKTLVGGGGSHQGGIIRWWNLVDGKLKKTRVATETAVGSVFYSPDGKTIISGSYGGHVNVWDARNRKKIRSFELQQGEGELQAMSSDGLLLAGSHDLPFVRREMEVGLWDARTGKLIRVLTGHKGRHRPVAFSSDGKILASGGNDWLPDDNQSTTVYLWNLTPAHS
jgi:WD40 repeat protein